MTAPDRIMIHVATRLDPLSERGLDALFQVFAEHSSVAPTEAGTDERRLQPLDEDALRDWSGRRGRGDGFMALARRAAPRFSMHIEAARARTHEDALCQMRTTFKGRLRERDRGPAFAFGLGLASAFSAEFALIHPIWDLGEESQAYSAAAIVAFHELMRLGPPGVAAVTWFGPHLTALMGRNRLLDAGGTDMQDAGVLLQLTQSPETAPFDVLRDRQAAALSLLAPAGVFGDYGSIEQAPGPNWVPFPEGAR